VRGVPVRWRTHISAWQPPHRFVDEQIRGPYRQWIHEHTFELRDGGTLARDVVRYAVPLDFLGASLACATRRGKNFRVSRTRTAQKIFPAAKVTRCPASRIENGFAGWVKIPTREFF
jgi:ligand-binding SRPBCC domain-containing protein